MSEIFVARILPVIEQLRERSSLTTERSLRFLIENRHGLVVDTKTTRATGTAEREAAVAMIGTIPGQHRITVGCDKAYDTTDFVADMRGLG